MSSEKPEAKARSIIRTLRATLGQVEKQASRTAFANLVREAP